ncbi:hypothetical protein [Pseudomonas sp. MWU13-2105]|uniref:hypothetical protein n=1 Tax=Pseudomonas sp. MWU13-2105 TaxID=2935074 RepID=UPI00200F9133|nr:hypothetical protein [Pseudomonas sp. MWU13-2105]
MSTQIADIVRCALSPARMATYEAIAPDADAALALYAWNAQICGALLSPLHICEVVVRNAVADAFEATRGARWPWNLGFERSLPRQLSPGYNALGDLQAVRNKVKTTGQVIAELKFVFWEKTFTSRHDSRIWEPQLMRVLPNLDTAKTVAQHRKLILDDLNQVRRLRNRIAHHEPIFARNLLDDFRTIQRLVEARCQVSADWMVSQQRGH